MGCTPVRSQPAFKHPILIVSPASTSPAQPNYPLYRIPSPHKLTELPKRPSNRREATCNYRRKSLSPVYQLDFWGTMPLSVLIDRLNTFHEEIQKAGGNFQDSFEYIQELLIEIGKDFDNTQVRFVKKSDKKFKALVGKFSVGIQVMKILGFREMQDCIKVDEDLSEDNWKAKIKEFGLAGKKIQ